MNFLDENNNEFNFTDIEENGVPHGHKAIKVNEMEWDIVPEKREFSLPNEKPRYINPIPRQ